MTFACYSQAPPLSERRRGRALPAARITSVGGGGGGGWGGGGGGGCGGRGGRDCQLWQELILLILETALGSDNPA